MVGEHWRKRQGCWGRWTWAAVGLLCVAAPVLGGCAGTVGLTPTPANRGTAASPAKLVLPAPLFFLHNGQIWRLERDGQRSVQVTWEMTGIDSFDVSPLDGMLVFVSANGLVTTDAAGKHRTLLRQGPALPVSGDPLAELNDPEMAAGRIGSPAWSPDGGRIAFIQNGLNVMRAGGEDLQVLFPNDLVGGEGEVRGGLVIDSLVSWAPEGEHLVVTTFRRPVENRFDRNVTLFSTSGRLTELMNCARCTFGWSADGRNLFVANPLFGGSEALTRCDVAEGRCTFIGQDVPARSAYFYAFPHVTESGEVAVFMGTSGDRSQPPEAFELVRVRPDGYGTSPIRGERLAVREALWAKDGRGVLVVTADSGVWLPVDGSPGVPVPVEGCSNLRWGAGD